MSVRPAGYDIGCDQVARPMREAGIRGVSGCRVVRVAWDNALAESFWESLKRECIQGHVFATRAEARRKIFRCIKWYNTTRLHTTLDGVPPIEWEQQYHEAS